MLNNKGKLMYRFFLHLISNLRTYYAFFTQAVLLSLFPSPSLVKYIVDTRIPLHILL